MQKIRALVADKDHLFREGLALFFERDPEITVVAQARTGAEACEQARSTRPDVALVELRLADMDGLAVARTIRRDAPETRVALIARAFSRQDLLSGIKSGVHGFITKDVSLPTLVEALKRVAAGESYLPPGALAMFAEEALPPAAAQAPARAETDVLRAKVTEREREVLQLIAQGATNRDIARRLVITENTVKVHLRNILDKLQLRNRQQAAAFAVSAGLVTLPSPEEVQADEEALDRRAAPSEWRRQRRP